MINCNYLEKFALSDKFLPLVVEVLKKHDVRQPRMSNKLSVTRRVESRKVL